MLDRVKLLNEGQVRFSSVLYFVLEVQDKRYIQSENLKVEVKEARGEESREAVDLLISIPGPVAQ